MAFVMALTAFYIAAFYIPGQLLVFQIACACSQALPGLLWHSCFSYLSYLSYLSCRSWLLPDRESPAAILV